MNSILKASFGNPIMSRWVNEPLVEPDGSLTPIFWVECFICGGEYPLRRGKEDGRLYVPANLHQVRGVDAEGKPCTPVYYASGGCRNRAFQALKKEHPSVAQVESVPHPIVTTETTKKRPSARR